MNDDDEEAADKEEEANELDTERDDEGCLTDFWLLMLVLNEENDDSAAVDCGIVKPNDRSMFSAISLQWRRMFLM